MADGEVFVGIRPEGFIPAENGALTLDLNRVEVMGRDISVVSTHKNCLNASIRSIVDADYKIDPNSPTVKFDLKPHKVFVFEKETEGRLY